MLTVFTGGGDQEVDGRACYQWQGLPPVEDIVERVGGEAFKGVRIQVEGVILPNERINTYTQHLLGGSYDGHTVIVSMWRPASAAGDALSQTLAYVYAVMQELFFGIVHGRAKGDHEVATSTS